MQFVSTIDGPRGQVVDVESAMEAARVDSPDVAGLFMGYVASATRMAEQELQRYLLTRKLRVERLDWGQAQGLRKGVSVFLAPVQSVDAVSYFDGVAWQPLGSAQWELLREQTGVRIVPAAGVVWPVLGGGDGYRVRIDLTVGYGDPGDVPECIKTYIKALCAYWFRHPMAASPEALTVAPHLGSLLDPERSWSA